LDESQLPFGAAGFFLASKDLVINKRAEGVYDQ
jgi:hypothetical protein